MHVYLFYRIYLLGGGGGGGYNGKAPDELSLQTILERLDPLSKDTLV